MKHILLLGGVAILASASQATVIIDDFTTGTFLMSGTASQYATQVGSTPNIVQAFRYEAHAVTSNPNLRSMLSEVNSVLPGNYFFESGTGVAGTLVLGWFNGLQNNVNGSGPGGLTTNDVKAFNPLINLSGETDLRLDYKDSDQTTSVAFGVYDATFSTSEEHSMVMNSGAGTLLMSLSNFTTVDLSQIGGMYLRFDVPNGNDFTITKYQAVPEPATLVALGAGLVAIVRRRKR